MGMAKRSGSVEDKWSWVLSDLLRSGESKPVIAAAPSVNSILRGNKTEIPVHVREPN